MATPPIMGMGRVWMRRALGQETIPSLGAIRRISGGSSGSRWPKTSGKEKHLVRKDIVAARLEKLRGYLKTLTAIRKFDLEGFKKDVFIHAAAERYLHLSIECLLDIGSHIISDRGYRKPDTYGEIFEILAEEGVISTTLLKELEGMAAFRNILVHDYFRLDSDQVYGILRDRIKTLEKLAKVYAALLE
jgi:uncharacterized protein YutE (UPF0331/DUF86 family)